MCIPCNTWWSGLFLCLVLMSALFLRGQQEAKQAGASPQQTCVVLKRMTPTDQVHNDSKALGKTDILDLLKGEVPSARVIELVKQRGIKFAPTEDDYKEILATGGNDELVNVLKAAALMRE